METDDYWVNTYNKMTDQAGFPLRLEYIYKYIGVVAISTLNLWEPKTSIIKSLKKTFL